MAGDFAGPMAMVWAPPGVVINTPENWPLKRGEVKHVGDPVAVVVATSKGAALDAADEVLVEYDPKPVVVDLPGVVLALEGELSVKGPDGLRTIAAADLSEDYLTTSLAPDEVVTEIRIQALDGWTEVHPPGRGLGDGRGVRARQACTGRVVRGRQDRAHAHGLHALARDPGRGRPARRRARPRVDRARWRAGGRGHRAVRGPQRHAGLQASPRARAPGRALEAAAGS
jgi:hypothetical protein